MRRVVTVLMCGVLAAAGAVLDSSPASAAIGYSHNVPFTWTDANNGISVLPVTFTAGDCRLEGTNQTDDPLWSSIQLVADPQPGQYEIIWNAAAYTVSTFFADEWHGTWYFESDNAVLFQIGFTSIPLSKNNFVYRFRLRYSNVVLGTDVAHSVTNVTWRGDC